MYTSPKRKHAWDINYSAYNWSLTSLLLNPPRSMPKRQAGRFAAQGRLEEAVACSLIAPWGNGSLEVLQTYGRETSLADLAERDQDRLLLTTKDAERLSKILGSPLEKACATRNILLVSRYAESISIDTLDKINDNLVDDAEKVVVEMIHSGQLPKAKIDQVSRIVHFTKLPRECSAMRELDDLATEIEKIPEVRQAMKTAK